MALKCTVAAHHATELDGAGHIRAIYSSVVHELAVDDAESGKRPAKLDSVEARKCSTSESYIAVE